MRLFFGDFIEADFIQIEATLANESLQFGFGYSGQIVDRWFGDVGVEMLEAVAVVRLAQR